jgi:hypothetical protein
MHCIRPDLLQVIAGALQLFGRRAEQVEPADNVKDLFFPADLAGVLGDIADPRVGAASDDYQSSFRPAGKGRIVEKEIGLGAPVGKENPPVFGIYPLERELPRDFAQKDEVVRDLDRPVGEGNSKMAPDLGLVKDRAIVLQRGVFLGTETAGMGDKTGLVAGRLLYRGFHEVPGKRDKTSRMVEVAVREDHVIKVMKPDSHLFCVLQKQPRVAGIKEDLLTAGLDKEREARFPAEVPVGDRGIIDKDGDTETGGHRKYVFMPAGMSFCIREDGLPGAV